MLAAFNMPAFLYEQKEKLYKSTLASEEIAYDI